MTRFLDSTPRAVVSWPIPVKRAIHLEHIKSRSTSEALWAALSVSELAKHGYEKTDQANLFCELVTADLKTFTDKKLWSQKYKDFSDGRLVGVGTVDATLARDLDSISSIIDCQTVPEASLERVISLSKQDKNRGPVLDSFAVFPLGRSLIKHAEEVYATRLRAASTIAKLAEVKGKLEKRFEDGPLSADKVLTLGKTFAAVTKALASTGLWDNDAHTEILGFADVCALWEDAAKLTVDEFKTTISKACDEGGRAAFDNMDTSVSWLKGVGCCSCAFVST